MSQQIEKIQQRHPLFRRVQTPGTWRWFWMYLLLGSASVLMIAEFVEFGFQSNQTASVFLILFFAIFLTARMHQIERAVAKDTPPEQSDHHESMK